MFLSESFSPGGYQATESWEFHPAEAVEQHPDYRQQADFLATFRPAIGQGFAPVEVLGYVMMGQFRCLHRECFTKI